MHLEARKFGDSAALMELALLAGKMSPDEEVRTRRVRAQSLRALDAEEQRYRETILEFFPPDERLALHEALAELDQAIALDEYDPELWNLKSAWCWFLLRYEEAVDYADRAIGLRPFNYAKPYMNKANALWAQGKEVEALAYAQETLRHAELSNLIDDIDKARAMVRDFSTKRITPTLKDMEPVIGQIERSATVTADLEIGQSHGSVENLLSGVLRRSGYFRNTMDYVPMMAELLIGATPETVFHTILKTGEKDFTVHDHCLHAALYVTAHSKGVQERDAARFLALSIMGALEGSAIRKAYREAILETSAAATDEMSHLDQIMREELGRMNPFFPKLIAEQEPVDEKGRQRAIYNILSRFKSVP